MNQRDRLVELLSQKIYPREGVDPAEVVADYLLANGVIVLPCRAAERIKRKGFAEGEWDYPEIMRHFTVVE